MTASGDTTNEPPRLPPEVQACVDQAIDDGMCVYTIDDDDSSGYDDHRVAKNLRYKRCPSIIAMCDSAKAVKYWFDCANDIAEFDDFKFVVRSGGHQHEARSTNDGAIVLDLSLISGVDVVGDGTVWIGSGTKLSQVVEELCDVGKVIPVGLCGNVNAGGLTHGGGWGLSWRTDGMTIDKLIDVEIVTPDGTHIESAADGHADLLKAVRGGGGGNFGVVIRLQFDLTDAPKESTSFSYSWNEEHRVDAVNAWVELMGTACDSLNSFARLSPHGSTRDALTVAGVYYGSLQDCERALAPLIEAHPPDKQTLIDPIGCVDRYALFTGQPSASQLLSGLAPGAALDEFALQVGPPGDGGPSSTCDSEYRHQVTSAFPTDSKKMIDKLHTFLCSKGDVDGANLYVSLHGMGGAGATEAHPSSYAWRAETYLIQGQAWWNGADNDAAAMGFISELRAQMTEYTKGAFLSFPDEALSKHRYYDDQFDDLHKLKTKKYDLDDRLTYPLGLTWPE